MKLVAIGRTQMLYNTITELVEEGHSILAIITAQAAPEYSKNEQDFEQLARELGVPCILTKRLDSPEVESFCEGADLGISINWISIIGEPFLNLFKLGILNGHTSDLPKYRGNACPNWALLQGESEIAATVHLMEPGLLDCGSIISQEGMPISSETTIGNVYQWLELSFPKLFSNAVSHLAQDPTYQIAYADSNADNSFRCYPRLTSDGFIDWSRSAEELHTLIRASGHPFVGAYTYQQRNKHVAKLFILESRLLASNSKDLAVPGQILCNEPSSGESHIQCGVGRIALKKCRYQDEETEFAPGKRWKSIRERLGIRAEDWIWQMQQAQSRK